MRRKQAKYYCPHCGKSLFLWKQHEHEDIYKCQNPQCSHYLTNKGKLTPAERKRLEANIYDPNFKLHYQYREYHFHSSDLKCARPDSAGPSLLSSIRSSYHTVGLVLSLFMNVGLSSRQTREVLKGLFGIRLSHQTVLNYVKASAAIIAPWLDRNLPKPGHRAAADETYITVEDEQHYTWFVIDERTRALCGYNLSNTRSAVPALATIYNAYGPPESNLHHRFILAKDGLGSYNDAIMAYNQHSDRNIIFGKTVVGLTNQDDVSEKYRSLKQLIERLNRTYKFHTRPRSGFKSMSGAIDLTVLFVAYYNFLRTHSSLHSVPIPMPELHNVESFPKQWEILLRKAAA